MKTDKIILCTVITGRTIKEFIRQLDLHQTTDMVELRTDSIHNLTLKDITTIKTHVKIPSIFTCRSFNEGGFHHISLRQRTKILQLAIDLKFSFVDIEYQTRKQIDIKQNATTKIIISYHNLHTTPSIQTLQDKILAMSQFPYEYIKIATKVRSQDDIRTLLHIISSQKNSIIIGLGNQGRIVRIASSFFQPRIMYIPIGQPLASTGQFTLSQINDIFHLLKSKI